MVAHPSIQRLHALRRTTGLGGGLRSLTVLIAAGVSIILSGEDVSAQPGFPDDTLRLDAADAVSRALSRGPEALRARQEIERARAGRVRAGAFFPSHPEIELEGATDAPFEAQGEKEWEVMVSQEIELGGEYSLRRSAADALIARAELDARGVELSLRAEVRSAHARLAAAQERIRLMETIAAFGRRLDTMAGRMLAVGEISELDRNVIRIERVRGEIELAEATAALTEPRATMTALLGLSHGTVVVATGSDGAALRAMIPAILDSIEQIERAIADGDERFIRERPELGALERELERTRIERALASRQLIPSIRLGLGMRSETTVDHGVETSRLLGFRFGVDLPLPIPGLYDFGQGDILLADAEARIIETEMEALAARIRSELARVAGRLRAAARTFELYDREIAPLVSRNLELLDRGYAAGELTATEVVTQQEQLLRVAESAIDAQEAFTEALAEFERVVGR